MITKFKIYEILNDTPKVGDYVYIEPYDTARRTSVKNISDFFKQNIGKIIKISKYKEDSFPYVIEFQNYIGEFGSRKATANIDDIKYFSPNIEDVNAFIEMNKFNL